MLSHPTSAPRPELISAFLSPVAAYALAMAKRKKRARQPKGGRTTPKGVRPDGSRTSRPAHVDGQWTLPPDLAGLDDLWDDEFGDEFDDDLDEPDLFEGIDEALADGDPLPVLSVASSILDLWDERHDSPVGEPRREPPPGFETPAGFVDMMLPTGVPSAVAVAVVAAQLSGDALLARRARRDAADLSFPGWIMRLGDVEIGRIVEMTHALGDGDNILIEATLPDAPTFTALVYVDHNLGRLVKDAFLIPDTIDRVMEIQRTEMDDRDVTFRDLDRADARARIVDGIGSHARTVPPYETESWPGCRPVIEWLIRSLPEGGTGYELPEWEPEQLEEITREFLGSPFAPPHVDRDHEDLMDSVLWFASGYGPGDPFHWSPVSVEILLVDWFPRKVLADPDYMAQLPNLLRGFIRYCHDRTGIRPELTLETLAAVDYWEPEYHEQIDAPRLTGPAAVLAGAGFADEAQLRWGIFDPRSNEEQSLDWLAKQVGGRAALEQLDDEPLPDEDFDWDGVDDDVRSVVEDIVERIDDCCTSLFDVEHRTATRRLLHDAAVGDPTVVARGRADISAAALCWTVARANGTVGSEASATVYVKDMMAHMGQSGSPSQRASSLMKAAGIHREPYEVGRPDLGSPRYLVSARRRRLIQSRDRRRSD